MNIRIIQQSISSQELRDLAKEFYGDLIKGVVDIKREIVALGGEMHADAEEALLKNGSQQSDLWGFNILLDKAKENCLMYESFINIRPRDDNKDLEVKNPETREKMKRIIFAKVQLWLIPNDGRAWRFTSS